MATKISTQDRSAMQLNSLGCWWPSRYRPGDVIWSGVANDLAMAGREEEEWRNDTVRATEMFRLARLAESQIETYA